MLILPQLHTGGAQRVSVNLANQFAAEHLIETFLVVSKLEGKLIDAVNPAVKVIDLNSSRLIFSIPALIRTLYLIKPSHVLSSMNYVNILVGCVFFVFRLKPKLILREANILYPKKIFSTWSRHLYLSCMKFIYRRCDKIICNSPDTLQSLIVNGVLANQDKAVVIPNPIDLIAPKDGLFLDLPFAPNTYIVSVGRLVEQKAFDILLEALSLVEDKDLNLVICGSGPLREQLLCQTARLGLTDRVHFTGSITTNLLAGVISNSKLFVLTSRWEGFGNVIVEALGLGIPVVASNCPGGPKLILDGVGVLVPVDDPVNLAKAIFQESRQPSSSEAELKMRARYFSAQRISQLYLDEF